MMSSLTVIKPCNRVVPVFWDPDGSQETALAAPESGACFWGQLFSMVPVGTGPGREDARVGRREAARWPMSIAHPWQIQFWQALACRVCGCARGCQTSTCGPSTEY